MNRHVALLRGINVGGKNKLPMRDLVRLFEQCGCQHVTTYIQSGNVVYSASSQLARRIPEAVGESIRQHFGYRTPIIQRTREELERILNSNPFLPEGEESSLHVAFLSAGVEEAALRRLDPQRSPPDRFEILGTEIYLQYPNGLARSKLTNAYFDSTLGVVSTFRNWRTTRKLLELASTTP